MQIYNIFIYILYIGAIKITHAIFAYALLLDIMKVSYLITRSTYCSHTNLTFVDHNSVILHNFYDKYIHKRFSRSLIYSYSSEFNLDSLQNTLLNLSMNI